MDLTTLASGLMWVWFLLVPPGPGGYADQFTDDLIQMRQPSSGRFRINGSVGTGGQSLPITGQGAFTQPDRFQLSIEAAGQRLEQIVIGRTLYSKGPNDRTWQVTDLDRAARNAAPPGTAPPTSAQVPPEALEAVEDVLRSFNLLGTESLSGVSARHYRGEIDMLKLVEKLNPEDATIRQSYEKFAMTVELWIGTEDHYLHQLRMAFDIRMRDALPGTPNDLQADMTLALHDLDQPVTIEPPIAQTGSPLPPTPTPTPRPAPAQVPAQVPSRAPARLPNTGGAPLAPLVPLLAGGGGALLLAGVGARSRRRARQREP